MAQFPGFPHGGFPEGWFAVGWADEFKVGKIECRRYFGKDLVLFRTESGRLVASSAYCPHMGARMDVGGRVSGECIVCPFHQWRWTADGENAGIPYADKTVKAKLKTYPIAESAGVVWIWNSWRSEQPTTDAPDFDFVLSEEYFHDPVASRRQWSNVRLVPQMVAENIVDGPHTEFVHLADEGAHIANIEIDGPVFLSELDQTYRSGKGPIQGKSYNYSYGIGTQLSKMSFGDYRVVNVLSTTPVEEDRSDMRVSIFIGLPEGVDRPRSAAYLPPKLQKLITSHLDSQEQDLPIWETMVYEPNPLLVGEEIRGHVQMRKWAKQFYES